jgi:hypothetical protein
MSNIDIPDFAKDVLKEQKCPACDTSYEEAGVWAFGRRRSKKDGNIYFWYEVECQKCQNPTMTFITSRDCDLYSFAVVAAKMYEESSGVVDTSPSVFLHLPKRVTSGTSKISEQELHDFKEQLEQAKYGDDVLKLLGMRQEDITRYLSNGEQPKEGEHNDDQ